MGEESLLVHVQKLLFKKYMKNHKNIYIYYFLSRGEENNRRRAHTFTRLKKKKKEFALLL